MKLSILSLISSAVGCLCNGNYLGMFLSPADGVRNAAWITNPIWATGQKVTLKWTTTQTTYNVSLWQQDTATNFADQGVSPVFSWSIGNGNGPGTYDWIVQPAAYGFDINFSPVFFLFIGPGFSITDAGFTSRYFNISPSSSAATLSTSPSTPSRSSINTSAGPPTASTTGNGNATTILPAQSSADGISTATKVGLGVGLGIGIPFLLILGSITGMKLIQKRNSKSQEPDAAPSYHDPRYQQDVKVARHFEQQELATQGSPTYQRAELYGGP